MTDTSGSPFTLELRLPFSAVDFRPDPFSHLGQFLLCLFDVSVRIKLADVIKRNEMKVDVPHAETFNGDAYPLSVRALLQWSGQMLRRLKDSGIEGLFQIEHIIDMGLRDQQRVAWITGADGEECQELLRLPDSMCGLHAFDDLTEDAGFHEQDRSR